MSWVIVAIANGVVAVAYLGIFRAILKPLLQNDQWKTNRLGLATSLIFLTCAVHHGGHTVHMLMPEFGLMEVSGRQMRMSFGWSQAIWDIATAGVGVYYWSLRRTYGSLMKGAKLFEDLEDRQRQALEINDNIVQGLTVAQLALDLDEKDRSKEALVSSLASARELITSLLGDVTQLRSVDKHAGSFVRSDPANVGKRKAEDQG